MFATVLTKEAYIKLIEYAFEKCNVISVTKYFDPCEDVAKNTLNIILSETNQTESDILRKWLEKDDYIDELFNMFKDNDLIFDRKCKRSFGGTLKSYKKKMVIEDSIEHIFYEYNIKDWLRKYKSRMIKKTQDDKTITYFFKLNDALKSDILSTSSFSDWKFPDSVENLSFYEDENCWLHSTWRGPFEVFCKNEKEFRYLKSLGVSFNDKKYINKK